MATSTNVLTNTTTPIAKAFLKAFETQRVLTKTVNTQLLSGVFNPTTGTQAKFKRPLRVKTDRTATGDISSVDNSDIVTGQATGNVQDYFTVHMDWDEVDEALKLGEDHLVQVMTASAEQIVTDLELDFGAFMYKNCNLHYGTPGTKISAWSDVAGAGALMDSIGVPKSGNAYYVMNPYMGMNLANTQTGIQNQDLVKTAWESAQISRKFGNMMAMTSSSLASYTSGTLSVGANRAGTLTATPTATYAANKDTMTMNIAVTGFGSGTDTIAAGEIVQVTGRNRVGLATKSAFTDATGAQVLWSGVVTTGISLVGGAGTINVAGPAIIEANGQYNTVASALTSGDVITILNAAASTVYQPAMFYHEQAFGIGSVPLKKLYATDTLATTKDGMQIRVCRYSDGSANKQKVRFDLLPAYVCFNPFFAGQGAGV